MDYRWRSGWLRGMQPVAAKHIYIIACLLSALSVALMLRYSQPFPKDDGAFFLRYADHIASGLGYTWNPGEKNGMGASAPLWPPLIALFMKLGLPAFSALRYLAITVSAVAFVFLFSAAILCWGMPSSAVLVAAIAGSGIVSGEIMGGLETPLTLLLLGAAFFIVARPVRDPYIVTLVAALLCIHKLDMLPWAAALMVTSGLSVHDRRSQYAMAAAGALVLVYLLAMKIGTGHVLPVSLSHKFAQSWNNNMGRVARGWFITTAYFDNGRWAITLPALLAIPFAIKSYRRMALFCAVGLGGQVLAYTLFPPTEPFLWYSCASIMGANMFLAGAAASVPKKWHHYALALVLCCGAYSIAATKPLYKFYIANSLFTENDRAQAGLWVALHTPFDFRVAAGHGNPAFYSHRYVYDYSGLNMAGASDLPTIIKNYSPEVLILCLWKTGIRPELYIRPPNDKMVMYFSYQIPPNYKMVKYFDSSLQSGYDDFYAMVMVRRDVENKLIQ